MKIVFFTSKLFVVVVLTLFISCNNCDSCVNYELCEIRKCECPFYAYGNTCSVHHFQKYVGQYYILSNIPGFNTNDTINFFIDAHNPRFVWLSKDNIEIKGIAKSSNSFHIQQHSFVLNGDTWTLTFGDGYFGENDFEMFSGGKKNNQDLPGYNFSMVGYKL